MNRTPLDRLTLAITILGALNWLLVGLFQYDAVGTLLGGSSSFVSRTVYTIIGLAGLYCITLLFRERVPVRDNAG